MTSRRRFIQIVPVAGATLLGARAAVAQAKMLDEKDPTAVQLKYVADVARADKALYKAGQLCNNCALYQGKASDPSAPCPLFANKGNVAAKGWCTAYAPGGPAKK
ncbi:MAG: high-potential iron-sulfur protein [Pseudomonadota bacterium]|jgi:hypothetical protein|nr:high-potential iron-sulfur protein [Rubrivivax sp.]MCA3258925.1 high-potential iron-sulfur protein [Rubrivivax sp.]MCE2913796.1 high-potential iron-sulfur protein [Rubrivivax sp.]MCZ8032479.1 high-potential iron-sulfur protein [Rubrivivax sp.]